MKMKSLVMVFVMIVLLAAVGSVSARSVTHFEAHLTGASEVPANGSQAVGQAVFRVDGDAIHYRLIVANLDNVRMAHIHYAPAGVNGGVSVWLYPERPPVQLIPGTTNGVLMTGTITQADLDALKPAGTDTRPIQTMEQLIAAMVAGNTYANVHTDQFPGGEIRGQIK